MEFVLGAGARDPQLTPYRMVRMANELESRGLPVDEAEALRDYAATLAALQNLPVTSKEDPR